MNSLLLPANTAIGMVSLIVSDLQRSLRFYEDVLSLQVLARTPVTARLAADDHTTLIELVELQGARPKPPRTTGLYHFAILLPTRWDLACVLRRLVQVDWPIQGASDHLVSEALYLADADGNGIEIYRDRSPESWPWRNGQIQMATDPLNVESLLGELDRDRRSWPGLPATTCIGHVHLHVADLPESERFYCDLLGFDVVQRSYPGALFVSAGGYHHHVGLNVWAGRGAPPPPADAVGLRLFAMELPRDWPNGRGAESPTVTAASGHIAAAPMEEDLPSTMAPEQSPAEATPLEAILSRLHRAGVAVSAEEGGWLVRDPVGNGILLTSKSGEARLVDNPDHTDATPGALEGPAAGD